MIVFVLGGTRSGKSEIAEEIASTFGERVTYVATATAGDDDDFEQRVARHRARRPPGWRTIEESDALADRVRTIEGTVLIDSTGSWIAGAENFVRDVAAFCRACMERVGDTVIVGEEVGFSVHPPTEAGRAFVDALGECNRSVADIADRVLIVIAGRSLELSARRA